MSDTALNPMKVEAFKDITLDDPFFGTLKADYPGFAQWFARKANEKSYVIRDDQGAVQGFLYLKRENGVVDDVTPPLPAAFRLKIGTFKVEAHGTKLGERCLKKAFDQAIALNVDEIYVTVFAKHEGLTRLFDRHGFVQAGQKLTSNGDAELVMVRNMRQHSDDMVKNYPFIHTKARQKFLLAIHPKWHTQLLPDSILNNETFDAVRDLSHTNSIHKVYICRMAVEEARPGDILVMYRTKDPGEAGSAEYRSVATSICVIEDVKRKSDFATEAAFLAYCQPYSVFTESELRAYFRDLNTRIVKFTYNAAMSKRLIRKTLIEEVGISRDARWSFLKITDTQFAGIVSAGGVNENLIIN